MENWEKTLICSKSTIKDALRTIDSAGTQMAVVIDDKKRLLGTITDGDIRRGILGGESLDSRVEEVMEMHPTVGKSDDDRLAIFSIMRKKSLHQIPIVNKSGTVVGLETINNYLSIGKSKENCVIIMAGGLGKRLKSLTRDKPKPMLKVGPRPIIETIILNFASQGFEKFYLSVNYMSEQISDYFGDGSSIGVDIEYIHEKGKLGTAGALSLVPQNQKAPIIISNADVLTNPDYSKILKYHIDTNTDATMCVRNYEIELPFGVVNHKNNIIQSIDEKPIINKIVSGGIYIFSPDVLKIIPQNQYLDMPDLFNMIVENGLLARAQKIDGYWIDVGRADDLNRANQEISEIFK
jgi:dTDP-glucose pyrophosphorylase